MALINLSVKHGRAPDVARAHFEKAIIDAQGRFGMWIRQVEWGPGRSSAKLLGTGIEVEMWVDDHEVHAKGDIPVFARLLEGPLKKFLGETFRKGLN